MERDYFISWSQQNNPETLDILSCDDFYINLQSGKSILEMSSISYQASFGLKNEKILESIKNQMDWFPLSSPKSDFSLKKTVTQKLNALIGDKGKTFFTTSGSESIENALKMAKTLSGKKKILARQKSYHGATLGALSVTGDWRRHGHVEDIDHWVIRIPEPDQDPDLLKTEEILKKNKFDVAAFCLETISGSNGVVIPSKKWWKGIENLCQKYRVYLIVDEIVCAFYRTGKPFGFHHYDINPDFICMAKAISGGYIPFGALWVKQKLTTYFDDNVLSAGLTSYAHPLGLAALKSVLEICEDPNFQKDLEKKISFFEKKLKSTNFKFRSIGLLALIEYDKFISWGEFIESNLHVYCKNGHVILCPALTMPQEIMEMGLNKLENLINSSVSSK